MGDHQRGVGGAGSIEHRAGGSDVAGLNAQLRIGGSDGPFDKGGQRGTLLRVVRP
jgi:hypothetical protein